MVARMHPSVQFLIHVHNAARIQHRPTLTALNFDRRLVHVTRPDPEGSSDTSGPLLINIYPGWGIPLTS